MKLNTAAISAATSTLALTLVTGCSSGSVEPALTQQQTPLSDESRALQASSEDELRSLIADSASTGTVPHFVTVMHAGVSHVFPPTATILRSQQALIVHAYGHSYAWPLSAISIHNPQSELVDVRAIPLVSAPNTDRVMLEIIKLATHFVSFRNSRKECTDCYIFIPKAPKHITQAADPWQVGQVNSLSNSLGLSPSPKSSLQDDGTCEPFVDGGSSGYCQNYYYAPGEPPPNPPPPPNWSGIWIALMITDPTTSSGLIPVPDAGHMYVQEWQGTYPAVTYVANATLEAGPGSSNKLQQENYGEHPDSDQGSFMTINGLPASPSFAANWAGLKSEASYYSSHGSIQPQYNALGYNCNSWAYGILLWSNYYLTANIQNSISEIKAISGKNPAEWQLGDNLEKNFI